MKRVFLFALLIPASCLLSNESNIAHRVELNGVWKYQWANSPDATPAQEKWGYTYDGPPVLRDKKTDYLFAAVFIPKELYDKSNSLFIPKVYQNFEFWCGSQTSFQFLHDPNKITDGYPFFTIPLEKDCYGQWAYFKFISDYRKIGIRGSVWLGQNAEHYRAILMNDFFSIVFSGTSAILGFALLLFMLFKPRNDLALELLSFSIFLIAVSGYLFASGKIKQLIWYNPSALRLIESGTLGSLPGLFMFFAANWFQKNFKNRLYFVSLLLILVSTALGVFALFGVIPMILTYKIFGIILGFAIAFFLLTVFVNWKERDKNLEMIFLCILFGVSAATFDLLKSLDLLKTEARASAWGSLAIIFVMTKMVLDEIQLTYQKNISLDQSLEAQNLLLQRLVNRLREAQKGLEKKVAERTKELSEALEELKELTSTKARLFSNISHELKTPLTLMRLTLSEMSEDSNQSVARQETLKRLDKYVSRLTKLVSEILELAKLESGKVQLNYVILDIKDYLASKVTEFQPLAMKKGIDIELNLYGNLRLVHSDIEKLNRIVDNLLINAIKYSNQGKIRVRCGVDQAQFIITIADLGEGIPFSERERIFESFYRLHSDSAGSGVGLSLVREYVQLMGGSIKLRSAPGKGSVFRVRLPRKVEGVEAKLLVDPAIYKKLDSEVEQIGERKEALTKGSSIPTTKEYSVLLVDDNPELLAMVRDVLRRDFEVLVSSNGQEALDILRKRQVDCIVSDIMMPLMNGVELFREVKSDSALDSIPFIFLSAKGEEPEFQNANLQPDDYLSKPFHPEVLRRKITRVLFKHEQFGQVLSDEKASIFKDFHDHLGAKFSNIVFMLEDVMKVHHEDAQLPVIHRQIKEISYNFRERLTILEDLETLDKDFVGGVHLMLLRRYQNGSRFLKFNYDPDAAEIIRGLSAKYKKNLYLIFQEVTTNDLKYGEGRSSWEMKYDRKEDKLRFVFEAQSNYSNEKKGHGTENLSDRVREMEGDVFVSLDSSLYRLTFDLRVKNGEEI